jgi:hypothetical protein
MYVLLRGLKDIYVFTLLNGHKNILAKNVLLGELKTYTCFHDLNWRALIFTSFRDYESYENFHYFHD